jgi:hypothetical protein
MATYRDIQQYVKSTFGYVPKTSWIADVKAHHGLVRRAAANRISPSSRLYPCPSAKEKDIEAALRHFRILR